jgi:FKBP-type peptidyl-prolyl cis-trans isomerase
MRSALLAALLAAAPALAAAAEPNATPGAKPDGGKPASPPAAAPAQKPASPAETEKTLYAVGLAVSNSLEVFNLTQAELDTVVKGIRDGWAGKPKFQLDAKMQGQVNDLARARAPKAAERGAAREKEAGGPYLAKMAKEKGATKTASGAIVIPVKEGSGPSPKATDKVKVHYTGTLVSGRVFDSSAQRGPTEFPLNGVIKCWTEALQLMKVGGKAKVVCPPEIAYGAGGTGGIPGNAVLTFDVELLEIVK